MAKRAILEREIKTYPPGKYFTMVNNWAALNEISKSKVAAVAIKQFFDTLPADERAKLMAFRPASKHSF